MRSQSCQLRHLAYLKTASNANWMGYYGDVRQILQGLEPDAYSPSLDQLDAKIGSLTIATSNE